MCASLRVRFYLTTTGYPQRSGGHAARVRPNAALTSFAAWFGNVLRAAEPGCFTCRGGRQAFGSPSPAQVSAALDTFAGDAWTDARKQRSTETRPPVFRRNGASMPSRSATAMTGTGTRRSRGFLLLSWTPTVTFDSPASRTTGRRRSASGSRSASESLDLGAARLFPDGIFRAVGHARRRHSLRGSERGSKALGAAPSARAQPDNRAHEEEVGYVARLRGLWLFVPATLR